MRPPPHCSFDLEDGSFEDKYFANVSEGGEEGDANDPYRNDHSVGDEGFAASFDYVESVQLVRK